MEKTITRGNRVSTRMGEVICGDCVEVMRGMGDNSVECVCTDLPYGEVTRECGWEDKHFDSYGCADVFDIEMGELLGEMWRVCSGSFYMFCGLSQVSEIHKFFRSKGCNPRLIVWEKTNPVPSNGQFTWLFGIEVAVFAKKGGATFNGFCENTVLRYPIPPRNFHPTRKPVALMRKLVEMSTNKGDIVLDPFGGSMTTGVACGEAGRRYIMIEREEEFCEMGLRRLVDNEAQGRIEFEY